MTKPLILVPLDGSQLSEGALPYAAALAKATDASVFLVTVWEKSERALIEQVPQVSATIFSKGEAHWSRYLTSRAAALQDQGIDVETDVRIGEPADEILTLIEREHASHLVVGTHGRSGISRWRYGSVASRLLREAPVPTLVVGPAALEAAQTAVSVGRILVPLDGSQLSEQALEPASDLAKELGAKLVLARVLQYATQAAMYGVPDVNVAEVDQMITESAEAYLTRLAEGLDAAETAVLHGATADALIALVAERDIDLIVMNSHGRGVVARAVLGSVADRLLQAKAPVYLVRPGAPVKPEEAERGRFCHSCGRAVAYVEVRPDDKCVRCGQHLHACGNCVYFDGISCIAGRPEQHDPYPGQNCPYFHFRETESPFKQPADATDKE